MRLEYNCPYRPDLAAIHAAFVASSIPSITGISCYAGKLYVEVSSCNELSDDQAEAINEIVAASILLPCWDDVRRAREGLLVESDWRIQRAEDQGDDAAPLRSYRRALRDITKQSDPNNVEWPAKPW